jgi:hypothetical protein
MQQFYGSSDSLLLWLKESAGAERRQAFRSAKHVLASYISKHSMWNCDPEQLNMYRWIAWELNCSLHWTEMS